MAYNTSYQNVFFKNYFENNFFPFNFLCKQFFFFKTVVQTIFFLIFLPADNFFYQIRYPPVRKIMVRPLVREGCLINAQEGCLLTPLNLVVIKKNKDIVQFLVTSGAKHSAPLFSSILLHAKWHKFRTCRINKQFLTMTMKFQMMRTLCYTHLILCTRACNYP